MRASFSCWLEAGDLIRYQLECPSVFRGHPQFSAKWVPQHCCLLHNSKLARGKLHNKIGLYNHLYSNNVITV